MLCLDSVGLGRSVLFIEELVLGPGSVGANSHRPRVLMCQDRNLGAATLHTAQPEHLLALGFCPLPRWHNLNLLAACYIRGPQIIKGSVVTLQSSDF